MSLKRKRALSLESRTLATIEPSCTRGSDDDHTVRNSSSNVSSNLTVDSVRSTTAHSMPKGIRWAMCDSATQTDLDPNFPAKAARSTTAHSRRKRNRWAMCDNTTQTEPDPDLLHDLLRGCYPGWKYDKDEPALVSAANICNILPKELLAVVKHEYRQIHAAWGCPTQKNRGEYRGKGERSKADIKRILAEAAEKHKIPPNRVPVEYGRRHISLDGKKATVTERRKEERCTECQKYGRYCEVVTNDDFYTRAICVACLSIRSTCSLKKVLKAESLRSPGERILSDIEVS